MSLPPGQRAVDGFPRFGTQLHHPPPAVPLDPVIEITGAVVEPFSFSLPELATLPRRALAADFHCVAGWSATDLHWEGVAFDTFYGAVIEPRIAPGAPITHIVFGGLDRYRSVATIEDALAGDVLIADRLDGLPLDGDHGAPARIVSPAQYGFVSTKHLSHIKLHTAAPTDIHRSPAMRVLKPHPRARVWEEERHRDLPAWLVRPVYRRIVPVIRALSDRA